MRNTRMEWPLATCVALLALCLAGLVPPARAADAIGIFERVLESSAGFDETSAALEASLRQSRLALQGQTTLALGEKAQRARVFVLTSPDFAAAAAAENPASASAQVLRMAVYESGKGRKTYIDMANPVAHAMVYYAGSKRYADLLAAARAAAQEMRDAAARVPGAQAPVQLEPLRSESALNDFDGDGPARMMARWRNWRESQQEILSDKAENFGALVERVGRALRASGERGALDPSGWRLVSEVRAGEAAVVFGITNDYTENKCVRINSDFRSEGRSEDAPLPGVDHAPALPLEVLVVNDGKRARVLQYGQMWRMQLYFWDSGYAAFAKNVGVPGTLFDSIEAAVRATPAAAPAAAPATAPAAAPAPAAPAGSAGS